MIFSYREIAAVAQDLLALFPIQVGFGCSRQSWKLERGNRCGGVRATRLNSSFLFLENFFCTSWFRYFLRHMLCGFRDVFILSMF